MHRQLAELGSRQIENNGMKTTNGKPQGVGFLLRFTAVMAPLFVIVEIAPLESLLRLVAAIETQMLNAIGINSVLNGTAIAVGNAAFEIAPECSGLLMASMLVALLYAAKTKDGFRWAVMGGIALFTFNIMRLLATIAVGAWWGEAAMDNAHMLLWFVDAAAVVALWAKAENYF